jgi:hypothetical protein
VVRALHSAVVPSALMAVDGGGGGGLSAGGPRLAGEAELMRIDFPGPGEVAGGWTCGNNAGRTSH